MKKNHKITPVPLNDKTIRIIRRVCQRLSERYKFGYLDAEDIEQEAFIIAMAALPRYDSSIASLETFLYIHISNKLKTFKRDNYFRQDFTCKYCGRLDPECEHCKRREWRLVMKKHLLEPIDIDNINSDFEKNMSTESDLLSNIELQEILSLINQNLDVSLREDYLRWKAGIPISKSRKILVETNILQILEDNGYYNEQYHSQ